MINVSIPTEQVVHGVKVYKLPLGKYLKALESLQSLPEDILKRVFPEVNVQDVLMHVQTNTESAVLQMAVKALTVAPEVVIELVVGLLENEEQKNLKEYFLAELSPKELSDILLALVEVNDLSGFFQNVGLLVGKWKSLANTGSKS